jgi:hypothetical protein
MSFIGTMKDKNRLGNMGNVFHRYDEEQNHVGKYGKCPSSYGEGQNRVGNGNLILSEVVLILKNIQSL